MFLKIKHPTKVVLPVAGVALAGSMLGACRPAPKDGAASRSSHKATSRNCFLSTSHVLTAVSHSGGYEFRVCFAHRDDLYVVGMAITPRHRHLASYSSLVIQDCTMPRGTKKKELLSIVYGLFGHNFPQKGEDHSVSSVGNSSVFKFAVTDGIGGTHGKRLRAVYLSEAGKVVVATGCEALA